MLARKLLGLSALMMGVLVSFGQARPAFAQAYAVDSVHSSVIFRIKHMGVSYSYGRFNDISGQIGIEDADPSKGIVDVTIKTASLDTGNAARDGHLKNADFFNAAQYKTINFKSTSIAKEATPGTFKVTGNLTLHGVTQPITVTLTRTGTGKDPKGRALVGYEGEFSIKRSAFKMDKMLTGASDDVRLIVSIEAAR